MGMPDIVMCSLPVNRPGRTRMPWWCGDRELEAPSYPIKPLLVAIEVGQRTLKTCSEPQRLPDHCPCGRS